MRMTSNTRVPAFVMCLIGSGACGVQASEEYVGEPLLIMRGQASTEGFTATADSVPALCFEQDFPDRPLRAEQLPEAFLDRLPEAVRLDVQDGGWGSLERVTHIVDVESHGQFPAEFDVDVRVPPPSAAIRPLVGGEPPAAFGNVCAVSIEHPAVVQDLLGVATGGCESSGCGGSDLRYTRDRSRFYAEHYVCPSMASRRSECQVTSYGDPQLAELNGGFESIYGHDYRLSVLYLSEPAPAGSYTAYRAGAPEGLSAGYHLRGQPTLKPDAPESCSGTWLDRALAEVNALYGTSYDNVDELYGTDDSRMAPPEVVESFRSISARFEMEDCPLKYYTTIAEPSSNLSIVLKASDPWLDMLPWAVPSN